MAIEQVFKNHNTNKGFINLLDKHISLDNTMRDEQGKLFISDWCCHHPFAEEFTKDTEVTKQQKQDYIFYSDDFVLKKLISKMHKKFDDKDYDYKYEILPSDGSSPLIATFCLWLFKNDIKEIYYVSPMYYTFYYFLELFKIRAKPVSANQVYELNAKLNLPNKKTILIICDPIWYVGQSIKKKFIYEINDWQIKTKSYIFLDGSFQYTQWNGNRFEESSIFDKEYTFRIVCATKFLALHGYRFSHLLLPSRFYEEILYIYANNIGSTNLSNPVFARQAINIMLQDESNLKLTHFIKNIYNNIMQKKNIETEIIPTCGYFMFGKIIQNIDEFHSMTQEYFEQTKYPNYVRINLLGGKNIEPFMK